MTHELAIPEISETLPATADALVEYGRNCLYVGKIATEQFGKACKALLEGEGSWTQRKIAEAMGCNQATVSRAVEVAFPKITNDADCIKGDHELPEASAEDLVDAELVEDDDEDEDLPDVFDPTMKADPLFDYGPEEVVRDMKASILGKLRVVADENLPDPEQAVLRKELHEMIDEELA